VEEKARTVDGQFWQSPRILFCEPSPQSAYFLFFKESTLKIKLQYLTACQQGVKQQGF
jgi:hypothetical protein